MVTERKKPGVTFESWVDKQIRQAQERGAFEGLEGAGKPIPAGDPSDEMWWLRGYLEREELSTDALLPTALQLRKEVERLPSTLIVLRREDSVREALHELNARIVDWIRFPTPPVVPLSPVNVESCVERWRVDRAAVDRAAVDRAVLDTADNQKLPYRGGNPRRPTWWHRVRSTFGVGR